MPGKTNPEFFRAGELAQLAGVSLDTLRYYERMKVLPPPSRSPNGYREYPVQTLDQIRQIQRALQVGFSLTEIAQSFYGWRLPKAAADTRGNACECGYDARTQIGNPLPL